MLTWFVSYGGAAVDSDGAASADGAGIDEVLCPARLA